MPENINGPYQQTDHAEPRQPDYVLNTKGVTFDSASTAYDASV